jgi:two-component system chemotaxis sensor kinase CheA
MSNHIGDEPMLEMYVFETMQLVNRLEQIIMNSDTNQIISEEEINEIFRIMHTIKGNSMMMFFENIANYAHSLEDLFDYLKANDNVAVDYERVSDLVLNLIDFIKSEIIKIESGKDSDGDSAILIKEIKEYLESLKFMNPESGESPELETSSEDSDQKYYISPVKSEEQVSIQASEEYFKWTIRFEKDCGMENVRSFTIVHNIKNMVADYYHLPRNIVEDESTSKVIAENGFDIYMTVKGNIEEVQEFIKSTPFVESYNKMEIPQTDYEYHKKESSDDVKISEETEEKPLVTGKKIVKKPEKQVEAKASDKSFISVGVNKIDKMMDLIGELVISESMVTRDPNIVKLNIDSFNKSSRQLRMVIKELQDIVMSVRMVPINMTFQKMKRIVRDMKKKTGKDVDMKIIGENTEVDKNLIELIGDPLMHIIRNSMDHGIETPEEREAAGKARTGEVVLEAKHSGGYVWIIVKDNGKGLDSEKIYNKAVEKGIISTPYEDMTDKEIYSCLFKPGFSTKEEVSEYSGRGVGLDVAMKNVEKLGGAIYVESTQGEGSEFQIKIPLTLAIIDGMTLQVGSTIFTLPTVSIKESFSIKEKDVSYDPDGHELVVVRGDAHKIIRLNEKYGIDSGENQIEDGILVMIESDMKQTLLFADKIIEEQQVVVKNLPDLINPIEGISGCTLLGDGQISMILDPSNLS